MDEINRKLEEILNDPESMNKVRQMAENLLGEDSEQENSGEKNNSDNKSGLVPSDISRIVNIIGSIESRGDDNRVKLLLALRPHLKEKRRARVDSAVKLLKLIEALPILKEAGILDFGG